MHPTGPTADNLVNSFKTQAGNYYELYDDDKCPPIDLNMENIIPHGWIRKAKDEPDVSSGMGTWANQISSYRCFAMPAGLDPTKMTTANVQTT
jgi:hypothetical protein